MSALGKLRCNMVLANKRQLRAAREGDPTALDFDGFSNS